MTTINPYLNFPGTTEEAFTLYKSVFGGEFSSVQRMKDTPIPLPMGRAMCMILSAEDVLGRILRHVRR